MLDSGNRLVLVKRLWRVAAAAIVVGTAGGIGVSVFYVLVNRYVPYRMFRLVALSVLSCWRRGLVLALLLAAALMIILGVFKRIGQGRGRRVLATAVMFAGLFACVEWLLDRLWLAYRVRPIGMWFHLGIAAVLFGMAWFLARVDWPGLGEKLSGPIAAGRRLGRIALVCLLLFGGLNLWLYLDGNTNLPTGPNVIIILSDALRKGHLGCYGYWRRTSPHIDAFAREAALFGHAFAQAPSTKPSVASLFTSLYPSQHRAVYNEDALPLSCLTLAEVLRQHKYSTAGFTENVNISRKFGFHQGFDTWRLSSAGLRQSGEEMARFDGSIFSWLTRQQGKPFFLYVHFIDPHNPYIAPPPFYNHFDSGYGGTIKGSESGPEYITHYRENRRDLDHLAALYDDEIRLIDSRFERMIDKLKEMNLLEGSLVIFLSDHGEEFLDHGNLRHATSVYAELINIPLIIRYPKLFEKGRDERRVQHLDLFPTLLAALHIDPRPFALEGNNLLSGVQAGGGPKPSPRIVSEYLKFRKGKAPPQRGLIYQEWKLVHHLRSDTFSLFNIEQDPVDAVDLIDRRPEIAAQLKSRLSAWYRHLKIRVKSSKVRLDGETTEKLKTLGYID
jgi:arylsulfatase A-like enzyme